MPIIVFNNMRYNQKFKGFFIGLVIILAWFICLFTLLHVKISWQNPLLILLILIQTHLYTGLFITAHDAIHGVVVPGNKQLNYAIGFFVPRFLHLIITQN